MNEIAPPRQLRRYMASSMHRRISSLYTLPMKIIPILFLFAIGILISVGFYFDPTDFFSNGVFFLLMLLAAIVFFAWHSTRMKFAHVDSDNLYVSGVFKSATIPLTNIQYVHYSPGVGLIIVRLKSPSVFGSTVAFMPTYGNAMLALFGQRSIVEELREMATEAIARSGDAI